MTRKDTILVAVIVNSALLCVLFVSALKKSPSSAISPKEIAAVHTIDVPQISPKDTQKKESEVDQILTQFVEEKKPKEEKGTSALNFAKELEAITKASNINSESNSALSKNASKSQEAKYYTVKSGDNPWSIAVKNKIKLDQLLKLNDLNEEKARRLKPGDKLRIQ